MPRLLTRWPGRLRHRRDELMNSILEEEEELINAHRYNIEETMEIVRKEMNLLTEVDQPGSAIDQYVDALQVGGGPAAVW